MAFSPRFRSGRRKISVRRQAKTPADGPKPKRSSSQAYFAAAAFVKHDAFHDHHAGRMARSRVQRQMLIAEVELVALMHDDVALGHAVWLLFGIAVAGFSLQVVDHRPVALDGVDLGAGQFLEP